MTLRKDLERAGMETAAVAEMAAARVAPEDVEELQGALDTGAQGGAPAGWAWMLSWQRGAAST